mmetsp:Transcript_10425/g.19043  ORF Transcript_10425/g.19043 Transcript_10425/m.19043 type:complete len:442 (-) Transcript_10425:697-2022(-)
MIVQEALDKIMADKSQTTIVIAHRLSTLRNVDRIAFIERGKVRELGTHDELMAIPNGRYRHLQSLQNLDSKENKPKLLKENVADVAVVHEKKIAKADVEFVPDKTRDTQNARRARLLAKGDRYYFLLGGTGAFVAGLVFPGWGFVFAYMVLILYYPVQYCDDSSDVLSYYAYDSCQEYWDAVADYMRDLSLKVFYGLLGIMFAAMVGNVMMYYGFGTASERMNKRIRDATFKSLIRQEVGWFDVRPVSEITTRLSDDAALIHSFSGQPIRMLCVNLASVVIGLLISLIYMWPFALLTLGIFPFMSIGKALEIKAFMGEDEDETEDPKANSSAGIVVESLSNIRTVAALTIEGKRLEQFEKAMEREDPHPIRTNAIKGSTGGVSQIVQMWGFGRYIFACWSCCFDCYMCFPIIISKSKHTACCFTGLMFWFGGMICSPCFSS